MKALALSAALVALASASAAIKASKVCVTNIGGYDLNWWVTDVLTGNVSNKSDTYPIGQIRCNDISIQNLQEGDLLEVYVHAVLGATKTADTPIIYASGSGVTLSYHCNGTTFSFDCTLDGNALATELPEDLLQ